MLTFESEPPSIQVGGNTLYPELRTPKLCGLGRVRYEILDLDRHMDSSEMTPKGESSEFQSRLLLAQTSVHLGPDRRLHSPGLESMFVVGKCR